MTYKVGLGTDFQRDTASGGLGVVDSLGTGLDVLGDLVVVGRGKGGEVAQAVEGDGVLGSREANSTGVAGDGARGDVVGGLGTDKEAVTANDSVGGEGGALEEVDSGAGVERGLLVDGSDNGRLLRLGGVQGGRNVELQALGDLVLELELSAEQVGGGPGLYIRYISILYSIVRTYLGKDQAVLKVDVLALNVTGNGVGGGILGTGNLEGDVGRGEGLDLERGTLDGVVLQEEVRGGLAEVLYKSILQPLKRVEKRIDAYLPGGGNGLRHFYSSVSRTLS